MARITFSAATAAAIVAFGSLVSAIAPNDIQNIGTNKAVLDGCFGDSVQNRALPNKLAGKGTSSSDCVRAAIAAGYAFAGTENGDECWAGAGISLDAYKVSDENGSCKKPCTGANAGTETCGGQNAIQIYVINPPAKVPTPGSAGGATLVGCYRDSAQNRLLPVKLGPVKSTSDCIALAEHPDLTHVGVTYTYAGTEAGMECWAGSPASGTLGYNPFPQLPSTDCAQACNGDNKEHCGNGNAIQVYSLPPPPPK